MVSNKIEYSGYWIFLNNPKNWQLDKFLQDNRNIKSLEISWTIPDWQKEKFTVGDYCVLRIGRDNRTKQQLNGNKKLKSGIYAIGRVKSLPHLKVREEVWDDEYNLNKESSYLKSDCCVDLEIILNLVDNPLIFEDIKEIEEIKNDRYLIPGFQSASIPLSKEAFEKIEQLILERVGVGFSLKSVKKRDENIDFEELTGEEKEIIAKRRIGHSEFKERLKKVNCSCEVCGVKTENLLVASHIKPWSKSNSKEKVDINNGLLLCPNHDYLFDKGFISFDDDGVIMISKDICLDDIKVLGLNNDIKIELSKKKKEYMKWHRNNIFKK